MKAAAFYQKASDGAQFFGFRCAGRFLTPPEGPARRIEVIGDSITCGYGVDGADQYCPFSAATENHYRTYAAIAARDLGADLATLAWSGTTGHRASASSRWRAPTSTTQSRMGAQLTAELRARLGW